MSICYSLWLPIPSSPISSTASDAYSFPYNNNNYYYTKTPNKYSSLSDFNSRLVRRLQASSSNNKLNDSKALSESENEEDDYILKSPELNIVLEIEKTGPNCRRIRSEIEIEAPLSIVWSLLTDYERLADFIPGLAVCQLLQKSQNYARLFQIGEQDLAFGLKFNAKGIVDCYENELENIPSSEVGGGHTLKRDIQFEMVEGDFEIFKGKWSLQQFTSTTEIAGDSLVDQQMSFNTTLSYSVDVKPKMMLPVRLVEGRLCKEIKLNLACIREEALKRVRETLLIR